MAIYAYAPGHPAGGPGFRCQVGRAVGAPWHCPLAPCAERCWCLHVRQHEPEQHQPATGRFLRVLTNSGGVQCRREVCCVNLDEPFNAPELARWGSLLEPTKHRYIRILCIAVQDVADTPIRQIWLRYGYPRSIPFFDLKNKEKMPIRPGHARDTPGTQARRPSAAASDPNSPRPHQGSRADSGLPPPSAVARHRHRRHLRRL